MIHEYWIPFVLTLFAGLSTGVGSLIALLAKKTNRVFLSWSLGFSAGVMIYVSMIEIFPKAQESLVAELGKTSGMWLTTFAFFAGFVLIAVIDKLIPSFENPHELKKVEDLDHVPSDKSKLHRLGIFTALAIAIHNFPEGLATFVAAVKDPSLGIAIAVAVAIHNIPEGIAVSVPIYYATGSRKQAFKFSFLSGLAEPLGAVVGFLLLYPFMSDTLFGILFAGVAGIMVFISLDELLPTSREYGFHHSSIYGLFFGMVVMALSLLLMS